MKVDSKVTNGSYSDEIVIERKNRRREEWRVAASIVAKNTFNPIRDILETMTIVPNPEKKMISLSIGDATVFGNLLPAKPVVDAVHAALDSQKCNGYGPSTGSVEARTAVAKHISVPGGEVTSDDVILCSGCSCALDIAISTLADDGQNILVPRPGFPLYTTLSAGLGIQTREYDLLPDQDWMVDLGHMESLIDHNTAAIIVNSPSNPCGSVFSPAHLREILDIAERHKVPIIADEIYDNFVFPGETYVPIASLTTTVPVLSCGGLTKRFLVPGWRMGWIVIYDRGHVFDHEVRKGLLCMSQRIIGSNTLVQGALPTILANTPKSFFDDTINVIQNNAKLAFTKLRGIPGLMPVMPQGAMYMMVRIDRTRFPGFKSDLQFVERLVAEQSVFCLPGKCFNYPNYVRIVLTVPSILLQEACERMMEFCSSHLVCEPPSRLLNLLVEHRSLYATYGKVHGRFLDQADNWHSTWQLAVTLAEAMNRKNSKLEMELERKNSKLEMERRNSKSTQEQERRGDSDSDNLNKESVAKRYPEIARRKGSIPTRAT